MKTFLRAGVQIKDIRMLVKMIGNDLRLSTFWNLRTLGKVATQVKADQEGTALLVGNSNRTRKMETCSEKVHGGARQQDDQRHDREP